MLKQLSNPHRLLSNCPIKVYVLGIVLIILTTWLLVASHQQDAEAKEPMDVSGSPHPVLAQVGENPKTALNLNTDFRRVGKQTIPAVVHIEVTERQEVVMPLPPFEVDPYFYDFFDVHKLHRKFERELRGQGTGMIMDPQGHILTNNHVVAGATKIEVLLASGKRYPAKVVRANPKIDVAVIRILAKESPPHVTFGNSDKVEVGERVVAVGLSQNLTPIVSLGIIKAKRQTGIMYCTSCPEFLQTDLGDNPGISGGPLLNLRGEVIGVNVAIASTSKGFGGKGMGFAIPINMALDTVR